ncbi:hypothetical protein BWI96_04770 [Siphonobacter sp. SORGH_AS_0500]|uniref:hypothetical protein n=1 Tax=Siphonobacter sp. SORGH_AS_0500 TaxID=1864824 RepID=UPI000CC65C50|nr:hypothetical protein [Siphonobacter sp. SORGH_AS_0500]PKK37782.1 hypothetical protein BWI96_04770 [Siphonobacter sp. SORGH_AS_0500]
MQTFHSINLIIHISFGLAAMGLGVVALRAPKKRGPHTRFGRYFLYAISVVVGTGLMGAILFRASPFLVMLTLLAGYVSYAGWRIVRLREKRSSTRDVACALLAFTSGLCFLGIAKVSDSSWNPSVIYSTFGALSLVTTYDLVKHYWLHESLKGGWLYEHIYKMLSAFSALLSAFAGNVLPQCQPYSQLGPSVLGVVMMIWYMRQVTRSQGKPV